MNCAQSGCRRAASPLTSTGRPCQRTPTDHVHVEVKHRLASTGAAVDHRAEIIQTLLFGNAGSHKQQMTQQGPILSSSGAQTLDPLARNHQQMNGCLGGDIAKGQVLLIAVDLNSRYLATKDLSEDRVVCHGP